MSKLSEYIRKERRWRRIARIRIEGTTVSYREFPLFGYLDTEHEPPDYDSRVTVTQGGWSDRWLTNRELWAAKQRWAKRSYKTALPEAITDGGGDQCGGCRYFAALDSNYGLCCNPKSVNDGRVTFEHGGCDKPSFLEKRPMMAGQP